MLWDERTRAKCSAKLTAGHSLKYITHYSVSVSVQQIVASISLIFFVLSLYSLLHPLLIRLVLFRFTFEHVLVPVHGAETSTKYIAVLIYSILRKVFLFKQQRKLCDIVNVFMAKECFYAP